MHKHAGRYLVSQHRRGTRGLNLEPKISIAQRQIIIGRQAHKISLQAQYVGSIYLEQPQQTESLKPKVRVCEVFSEFSAEPVAAASLAQVYKAVGAFRSICSCCSVKRNFGMYALFRSLGIQQFRVFQRFSRYWNPTEHWESRTRVY